MALQDLVELKLCKVANEAALSTLVVSGDVLVFAVAEKTFHYYDGTAFVPLVAEAGA